MLPAAVPRVIVGTARMGSLWPDSVLAARGREPEFALLDAALDLGCSAFDTAASYRLGGTERVLGAWMASRRNRDRLYLISKGGLPHPVVKPHRLDVESLSVDLHGSLRRLRVDCLDLYLLHRDDQTVPLESVLETMNRFERQGKIRAWGVSNWTHSRIEAMKALASSADAPAVAASSPHFSLFDWVAPPWPGCVSIAGAVNANARAYYERTQIPVLAWSPLGGGFLSRKGPGWGRWASHRVYDSRENRARKERVAVLARRYDRSPAQVALAYVFSHPFPVFAVVSSSTTERMECNLRAASWRLSPDELRWLESGQRFDEPLS
ncbi:MAG TPA: aldo/keto reductase [Polyangiaceae bacterium]|nr:aldo/keto reductase [Polyangiaceae bacterium]